jgi:hypothetical protein
LYPGIAVSSRLPLISPSGPTTLTLGVHYRRDVCREQEKEIVPSVSRLSGIGENTSICTVVNTVLLKPFDYPGSFVDQTELALSETPVRETPVKVVAPSTKLPVRHCKNTSGLAGDDLNLSTE